jgi:Ca2+-binding RTX toxin-like protein
MLRFRRRRGAVSHLAIRNAPRYLAEGLEARMLLAVNFAGAQWDEQGPGPLVGPGVPAATSGAVEAIAFQPGSSTVAFAATVDGGVWRTENAQATSPTWEPVTDFESSLGMGAIAISPVGVSGTTPTRDLEVFAGFAVLSSGSHGGGVPQGMLFSEKGGAKGTWKPLARAQLRGLNVRSILPDPSDPRFVFVAASSPRFDILPNAGLWRVPVDGSAPQRLVKGEATSIIVDDNNDSILYVGIRGKGILRNTTHGTGTWSDYSDGLDDILHNGVDDDRDASHGVDDGNETVKFSSHVELVSSGNEVYSAVISAITNRCMAIYHLDKATNKWTFLPKLPNINTGAQGFLHFSMTADPNNHNILFVGGDRSPNIWRADVTKADPWEQASGAGAAGGGSPTQPHSDSRAMTFDADGHLWEGDDGGIYRLTGDLADKTKRTWDSRNNNLAISEFYSVAYDTLAQRHFGGLQDNGLAFQKAGTLQWDKEAVGDGTIVAVDNSAANSTTYFTSSLRLGNFKKRVIDNNGALVGSIQDIPLIVENTGKKGNPNTEPFGLLGAGYQDGKFDKTIPGVTPFAINATDSNLFMIGTGGIYESIPTDANGATVRDLLGIDDRKLSDNLDNDKDGIKDAADPNEVEPQNFLGRITAIAYGGFLNGVKKPEVAYVAGQDSFLTFRDTKSFGTIDDFDPRVEYKTKIKGGTIRDISLNSDDYHNGAFVDDKGRVYQFKNAAKLAADITPITGNLGKFMTDLRTVEVIRTGRTDFPTLIVVGGVGGVYVTNTPNGANTKWVQVGTNAPHALPHTVVGDLHYDSTRQNDRLYVGTFGRGVWSISGFTFFSLPLEAKVAGPGLAVAGKLASGDPGVLTITGDDPARGDDTFRLVLEPGSPAVLDVFVNNAADPAFSIDAAAVQKVIVNGGAGTNQLVVDHVNGLVSFPEGIDVDGSTTRQDVNQTALDSGIVAKLRSGLQTVADWSAKLATFGEMAQQLPGLGRSIADTLSIGDGSGPISGALQHGLVDRINDYFTSDAAPTVQKLTEFLKSLSQPMGDITFGVDPLSINAGLFTNATGNQELRFDLATQILGTASDISLDFGADLESLGLNFKSSGVVHLDTKLDLNLSFGIDLTPGLSDSDAFFITVNDLSASARVSAGRPDQGVEGVEGEEGEVDADKRPAVRAEDDGEDEEEEDASENTDELSGPPLEFELNLGFLKGAIHDGSLKLDAKLHLNVVNPDDDANNHITLAELTGNSIDSLLDVDVDGDLQADLPFEFSLPGFAPDAQPVIHIRSDDLFDEPPQVIPENFEHLFDFNHLSPAAIFALIRQFADAAGSISHSGPLQIPIPLTSKTLGDAVDFGAAMTDKFADLLADPNDPNAPAFTDAQSLADLLAAKLGLDPSVIQAKYDAEANELTYHVSLSDSFATADVPLNLGIDLSPVGSLTTSSTFKLAATAGADFTFGFNLNGLAESESLADHFFIENATLSGSANLDATDIDALAKVGFLGVGVQDGSGELSAAATINLQNPAPDAKVLDPKKRLTLSQLVNTLTTNAASLIAPKPVTTTVPSLDVNVSQQPKNQNEPAIAIDPSDPMRMFEASNNEAAGSLIVAFSTDGGATWTSRELSVVTDPTIKQPNGDPSVLFDRFGNLYLAYLGNDKKVALLLSTDGGKTLSPLKEFSAAGPLDRTALATGPGDTADSASLWIAYTDVNQGVTAAGARVTGPGAASVGAFSTPALMPGSTAVASGFPDLAVGPRGQVLVSWSTASDTEADGPSKIYVNLDADGLGSAGFGPAQLIAESNVGPNDAIPPQPTRKITADPHIAFATTGGHVGRAYIVYTDESAHESDDTDIWLKYSDAADATAASWSKANVVSRDAVTKKPLKNSQFFGRVATDPKTGYVAVAWYDARNDTNNHDVQLFATVSTDGGASFEDSVKVSSGASDESQATYDPLSKDKDYGDYIGLAYYDGKFFPAWTDNAGSTLNHIFEINTAKVTVGQIGGTGAKLDVGGINFTGSANATLPIVVSGIPITLPADAKVTINWPDLSDPGTLDVQFPNLDDILNFEGLNFDSILAALQGVLNYLSSLKGLEFLNYKLPILNASASDLLDFTKDFADDLQKLRDNPVGTLQEVAGAIEQQFGLSPGTVMLALDDANLKVTLNFGSDFSLTRNLNLDLASLLGSSGIGGVVNISGSANLNVAADTNLKLDLGIDLSDSSAPKPFLYGGSDGTHFTIDGAADAAETRLIDASNLNFSVAIGPLSGDVVNGSVNIHKTGAAGDHLFNVSLADGNHYFDTLSTSDVTVDLNAAADIVLPISLLGINFPPPVTIQVGDLAAFFTDGSTLTHGPFPDFASKLNLDLTGDLSSMVDGFDQLLALLQTALDSKAFNRNLPIVGKHLTDGAQVIGDFRSAVISPVKTLVDADKSLDGVRNALFSVLGPSNLDVLGDLGTDGVTVDDIVVVKDNDTNPDDVRFDFHIHKPASATSFDPDFDIGIPALQLSVGGQVNIDMGFDFAVGLGVNRFLGAYFDTTASDELKVDFGVDVKDVTATGNLGFLQLDVDGVDKAGNGLFGTFNVDLTSTAGKLTANNLSDTAISAHLDATANLDLGLTVSFGDEASFPDISSTFHLLWDFDNDTTDSTFGSKPQVAFKDIQLDMGTFFSGYAKTIFGTVKKVLDPVAPIIDFLDSRIEWLEKIGSVRKFFNGGVDYPSSDERYKVTVRDVIAALDPDGPIGFVDGVISLKKLVDVVDKFTTSNVKLNLGEFDLNDQPDLRTLDNLQGATITRMTQADTRSQLEATSPEFAAALYEPKLGDPNSNSGGTFSLPLLQKPSSVFKLFLGQDVDLFRWDTPKLDLHLAINQDFKILGPIEVTFGGALDVAVQGGFGYDTAGLRKWRSEGGGTDAGSLKKILDGFYLVDKPAGSSIDTPEVHLGGSITAGVGLDVFIASASVDGSLIATVDLDLVDPDSDGKVRFKELSDRFAMGPFCIFDLHGSLDAQLSAHVTIGHWPLDKTFSAESPLIHILDFEHSCDELSPAPPVLATDIGGGVLRLNVGPYAPERVDPEITSETAESYTVDADPDVAGNVRVKAFGLVQSFPGITSIFADAGSDNDVIFIDPKLDVTSTLVGGGGNDVLSAGKGSATIVGDDVGGTESGDDQLGGSAANDMIFGGQGNDVINGRAGDDKINGQEGADVLYGEEGKDTLTGGVGNYDDQLFGGAGDDTLNAGEGNDYLDGEDDNDKLTGDAGNDVMHGGAGNDNETGGDGEDQLAGDAGNDVLDGGNNADQFDGGDGDDTITGGAANDVAFGGAGKDNISGGADQDQLHGDGDDDTIDGGAENDDLYGDAGNDNITGADGNDYIDAGEGDDMVDAGVGTDLVFGRLGNDNLKGGDDADRIFGDEGNDTVDAGTGDDLVEGGTGNDKVDAGAGTDTVRGQEDNDQINGQGDADQLFGDGGDDTITGGAGADYIEGGADNDTISGDEDADVIFGNAGNDLAHGNAAGDTIRGGTGGDVIFGDASGDLLFGDEDDDAIVGDEGQATFNAGTLTRVQTANASVSGDDYIDTGGGADTALGGSGADQIIGGSDSAADILLGDNGAVVSADGSADANDIFSSDPDNGGVDAITGGPGNDIVIGGTAGDNLAGAADDDVVLGDHGRINRNSANVVESIATTSPDEGGDDAITTAAGGDIALGGFGADQIDGGDGNNILLGDNGQIAYASGALSLITTNNPTLGAGDTITTGSGSDILMGGTGPENIHAGDGADLVFGDHGKVDFTLPANANFTSIDTGAADGGAGDEIHGEGGNDIALGGQGGDKMLGDAGDDDLIGGHNVPGADGSDTIDGGADNDVIVADNGAIVHKADSINPRFRTLSGTALYSASGAAAVNGAAEADPSGVVARTVTLVDTATSTPADHVGDDYVAGGAGADHIFGGLGNDVIQGDGSIDLAVGATLPSVTAPTDGSDYIEGNGGNDVIFGNGGADDVVGGSSDLFGLTAAAMRPDGGDVIFGGSGTQLARNDAGDNSASGHAADSDYLVGDNGAIYRIVSGGGGGGGALRTFNYDNYGPAKIVVRAANLLDYTPGTGSAADLGGDDVVHGEAGDDFIHGQLGNDVLFGDGQDDDIIAGAGSDRVYGGTGEDGILGDDGLILTSRNGLTEPLNGIASVNAQANVTLSDARVGFWSFITGRLNKQVDLTPFASGGNDLMYGGLGDDFMHGGAGDDAMSGAEAQSQWYNDKPAASFFAGLSAVTDAANPLGYNSSTTKFAAFNATTTISPMQRIADFFLNFDATDGSGGKINDGKDRLFGDVGNDWLVGGTQNDRMFGGAGDDVMNADDNLDTNGGLNNQPDAPQFADADFAFGGLGRDALTANTGRDRLYDWVGEYNTFVVPFSIYDGPTVNRFFNTQLEPFLTALGRESGSDRTVTEPSGELALDKAGNKGGPRDPQPGNIGGTAVDTLGTAEDDRSTGLPI